ncbi:hypothetical protein QFC22_003518 [Naganishia vaughanmartiniae]|uniref:Uncharacterized protein n=1 Tax=Naganishia vaughanmartiniae TaxID=1424756 RepID=A0ACC2X5N1_9TREE|nr:hypothetical protein QFC22_003518 [Naganishia vaughanmartiniae]
MLVTFSSIALGASSVHLYRQLQPTTSPSNPFLRMSPLLVIILNLVSFVSSGLMRREPKLYYRVPAFQLGSGLQATMTDENEGLKNWLEGKEGGVEPIGNVLDYDGCGVLPLLTGLFVFEVWRKSWTKPQLDERDLPQLPQRNRAQAIASEETNGMSHEQNFEDPLWQKKDEDGNPEKQFGPLGLLVHVWKPSLPTVIYGMILTAIATGLQFLPLLMDRQIIVLFEDGSIKTPEGRQWGYLMCFGASGLRIASFVVSNYTDFLENYLLHGRVRIKMEQMLYGKLLRSYDTQYTASTTNQEAAKGADKEKKTQLVTLFGNDMQQICIFAAPLALVIMLLPIVRYYTRSVYRMSRRIPAERDKRVSVIRELIQNIKAIKLNAWEDAFEQKATLARERELKAIKTSKLAEAVLSTLEHWIPILAICLAYILHVVVRGEPFPPSTALIAQRTFAEALKSLLKTPKIINCVLSMRISCERLCDYLNEPEIHSYRSDTSSVGFRRVSATWHCPLYSDDAPMSFKLDSMSFAFCPNSLNIVAGPTGSGKTLLLLSILGEAKILDGSIDAPRSTRDAIAGLGYRGSIADAATRARWLQPSIAYTPQTAYIEHGTIRDNIIFGQVFWEERYNQVLQACSLVDDLATLADGDMTELSTDTLSGGQQSRINLARSLYSRAQVMLLDDPLSAVDEKTAKHILEHALTGALVKGRTVILVTHKLSLCASKADRVVVLCNGRIAETLQPRHMERTAWMHLEEIAAETDIADRDSYIKENPETKPTYQLVKDEERKIGLSARRHLLSILVTAGGLGLWALILVSLIINEFLAIYHTAWTASWSSHENSHGDNYYALGSFVITLSRGIMMFFSAAVIVHAFTWRASAIMHRRLLSAFLAAPLQTMQTIPSGRFLNRFATDMEYFDLNLAYLTQTSLRMFFSIVGRFVSTTIQVPALLWVILAVLPILFSSQARLAKFLSDAKKLNAIWNSPLLTMINDSEHAVTVIRAFGAGEASAARMRLFQTQKRMAGLMEYSAWLLSR